MGIKYNIDIPEVQWERKTLGKKRTPLVRGYKWHVPYVNQEVSVHGDTLDNLRQGLVERVFRVKSKDGGLVEPPRPVPSLFKHRMSWITSELLKISRITLPLSRESFLSNYSGSRRDRYSKAADEYERRGVRKEDAKIRAFIKIEALVKSVGGYIMKNIVPRIIQPRNPRLPVYGYALGRFIRPYEYVMKDLIAKVGYQLSGIKLPVILKGLNVKQRAEVMKKGWDSIRDPCAVSMDISRFDQHIGQVPLKWEAEFWLSLCPASYKPLLRKLLSWQLVNKGVATAPDGKVRYTTNGCRMSGDMNTSAGNCLIMSSMLLSYIRERGVKAVAFNDGDDSVVFLSRRDVNKFVSGMSDWFLEMGFTITVEEVVNVFERVEFCQCRPVLTHNGYILVRNPHKAMAKDTTHVSNFPDEASIDVWLSAVGDCGMALTDGVPVYQAFYRCFDPKVVRHVPEALKDKGFYFLSKGCKWNNLPITDEARVSFYKAFGITPDEQLFLESEFSRIKLKDFPTVELPHKPIRLCSPLLPRM